MDIDQVSALITQIVERRFGGDVAQEVRLCAWRLGAAVDWSPGVIMAIAHKVRRAANTERHRDRNRKRAAWVALNSEPKESSDWSVPRIRQELQRALAKLSVAERRLLEMRFQEARTYKDIGAEARQPERTIQSRIRRSLARLRGLLPGPEFFLEVP